MTTSSRLLSRSPRDRLPTRVARRLSRSLIIPPSERACMVPPTSTRRILHASGFCSVRIFSISSSAFTIF